MQHIDPENGSDLAATHGGHDSLALLLEYARQDDGGPYRSRREALLERRRRLTEELAAVDRVWAQRRAALLEHLNLARGELAELEPTPQPSRASKALWMIPVLAGMSFGAVCFSMGVGMAAGRPVVVQAPPVARFEAPAVVARLAPPLAPFDVGTPVALAPPRSIATAFRADLVAATMTNEPDDTEHAIRHVARGEWSVDRARLPLLLAWSIRTGGHFEPTPRDGAPAGMRLFGVRRGGVLQRLGFQNGDVLVGVAGLPVRSPEELLAAYARLRDAPDVYVALERNGEPRVQHYTIGTR